jgi:ABC-type amino acid transport system permease subunit
VTLTTFNVLGQQVQRAIIPPFSGQYLYHYDGASLSTGIYFLRVQSGRFQITQKLMLLR